MDVWHYRLSILEHDSLEGSFITALSDSDYNPEVVERLNQLPSVNGRTEIIVKVEIEDEELKNNLEALMEVFDICIITQAKQGKVKTRTKLKRYTKHRLWEMISICGGTLAATTIPLIHPTSTGADFPNGWVFGCNFKRSTFIQKAIKKAISKEIKL